MRSIPLSINDPEHALLLQRLRDTSDNVTELRDNLERLGIDEFEDNLAAIEAALDETWEGRG